MSLGWIVSLRDGVTISSEGGRTVVLRSSLQSQILRECPPAFHPLLEKLASPGMRYEQLLDHALRCDVANPIARLVYYLQFLARRGFVIFDANAADQRIATFEPTGKEFKWPRAEVSEGQYLLSQYAYIHRVDDRIVLDSPLASGRVVLHDDRVASIVSVLGQPASIDELVARISKFSRETVETLVTLLHATHFLTPVNSAGESEEGRSTELQTWEFHDLLFHVRSRLGRHNQPVGATYRFFNKTDPPPVVKPVESEQTIQLAPPDLAAIREQDLTLCEAVESRRSIREYGDQPISLQQLGDFLYRTMRVRTRYEAEVDTPHGPLEMEFVSRPYPSGGALYELEAYSLIQHCSGLSAGLYRYDACDHQLVSVSEWTPDLLQMVQGAGDSTGISSESIQVVLILSSRFPRVAWKYTSIAYALTLKHVGAVYQTMYLTATAMGLSPCAMGAGDSDVFARAIGSGYYAETSVGEFLLGSRPLDRNDQQE